MDDAPSPTQKATPIPVVDHYGNFGTLDPHEAPSAFQSGAFRPATDEEISNYHDEQNYGEGLGNSLKAFGAGAGRGATFGLSDQALTKSGLVEPKTLQQLKQRHPIATTAGEVAGIAGSMALAPEMSPVGLLGKAGEAVAEGAAPLAESVAGYVANPETSPIINRMLSGAGSQAAGSAVEGAAYGLGQSVSEQALGDPNLNAEKLMSNVGYGALFGGALGGMFGGLAKRTGEIADVGEGAQGSVENLPERAELAAKYGGPEGGTLTEADIPQNPTLEQALDFSGAPDATKEAVATGMSKLKENASEIDAAGKLIGAPTLEGMVSSDQQVQRWDSLLTQSPSVVGVKRQQQYAAGYNAASTATESALGGEGAGMSLAEIGDSLKSSLTKKLSAETEPITQLYNELKESTSAIPLNQRSLNQISGNIRKLEGTNISSKAESLANDFADRLTKLKTVDEVKQFKSVIRDEMAGIPSNLEKRIVSQVSEKLTNLEENSILSFAETQMKTPLAKQRILGLIEQRKTANAAYTELRDKMSTLGDVLGKRRIQGPQDFINSIDEMTPEKFATRLFSKNNSEFLGWFSKEFPEETKLLTSFQKSEIMTSAMKSGQLKPTEIFKSLGKMSKELKNILFTPEELTKLKAAQTWIENIPKDINPSHTSMAESYRKVLTNPLSSVLENAKDYGILKGIKHVVGDTSGNFALGDSVGKLSRLEGALQKTSSAIESGTKGIFNLSQEATPKLASYFGSADPDNKKSQKLIQDINERAGSPEALIDSLDKNTKHLYAFAPQTAGGMHEVAARATQFLASKVPQMPPKQIMSPDYEPSASELASFHRYYSTVENPTGILNEVKHATLTPESLETIQMVYPKMYQEMKTSILSHLTQKASKKDATLPYATRLSLSAFLGQDLSNTLNPQNIQSNQMVMSQMGGQAPQTPGAPHSKSTQSGLSQLNTSTRAMTDFQASGQRRNQ